MAQLILIRHGQSQWNEQGLWTGWNDIELNEKGHQEARDAAEAIRGMHIDLAFTSDLKRAQQTYEEIKLSLNLSVPLTISAALKERNYGSLAGKNKWKVKEEFGEEQFLKWRRSWDYPIPEGESLKDVYTRVIPYYTTTIQPALYAGKNILIAAHGNSLRALIKYLEDISDEEIPKLEIGTGEVYVYDIDNQGKIISKEIKSVNLDKTNI